MSDDDDDDEVAIEGDMEPENATGEAPSDDDDYDDGDDQVAGGPVTRVVSAPRGTRPISDKVRELAKAIAAANKGKVGRDSSDLPSDDDLDVEYDENPNGSAITSPPD